MKGRAETKPILVLVDSIAMANSIARLSDTALSLAERFWPGPLTMILPARASVSATVTAGSETIGVRWANTVFTQRLLEAFGRPITATSANRSGLPSAVTAEEVRVQLGDSLEMLVDGGELPARQGSTLLDVTQIPVRLLREGPIAEAELSDVLR